MYIIEIQLVPSQDKSIKFSMPYKNYEIQVTMQSSLRFGGFDNDTLDDLHPWQAKSLKDYLSSEYIDSKYADDSKIYLNEEVKNQVIDKLIGMNMLDNLDNIVKSSSDEDYFLPIIDKKDNSKVTNRYDAYDYHKSGLIYVLDRLTLTQYIGTPDEIVEKLKETLTDWDISFDGFGYDKSSIIQQDCESNKKKDEPKEIELSPDEQEIKDAEQDVITKDDCANINWPDKDEDGFCNKVLQILRFKRAILLQGPPGTGKTKMAEALAYKWFSRQDGMMGTDGSEYNITPVDSYHFCEVQFSEEYSYSDFVEGLKPDQENGSWVMTSGPLKHMCEKALKHPKEKFILFIDEINRANTEAVIGEMLNLMEKRDRSITLKSGSRLKMPYNLYIIATMNTIDRGAGTLNFATISRFAEIDIEQTSRSGAKGKGLNADDILTHKLNPITRGDIDYTDLKVRLDLLMQILDNINDAIAKDNQITDNSSIKIGYRCLYTGYQNSDELDLAAKYDLLPELKCRKSRLREDTYEICEKAIKMFCENKEVQSSDIDGIFNKQNKA